MRSQRLRRWLTVVTMLALPVLAGSASYALSESFGWREGLSRSLRHAYGFYGVIIVSTLVGLALNFAGIDPIKALFYSQVLVGLLTPFLVLLILILCNNKKIMGEFANGWFDNVFGTLTLVAMLTAGIGFFWQFFS